MTDVLSAYIGQDARGIYRWLNKWMNQSVIVHIMSPSKRLYINIIKLFLYSRAAIVSQLLLTYQNTVYVHHKVYVPRPLHKIALLKQE